MEGIRKENYSIKPISKQLANDIVIKHHYLHRKPNNVYSFGLFDKKNNNIVGVIIYGTPASRCVQRGICGDDYADDVIELTRLWIDDKIGKNGESFLIGNTLKMIDKKIIVSYAEKDMGHVGRVYQSTNWIYTGLTEKRTDLIIDGDTTKHPRGITSTYGSQVRAEKLFGDRAKLVDRPRKHRYIYFNCGKRERKFLLKKLKYPILPYPDGKEEFRVRETLDQSFNSLDNDLSIFDL